jgi:hypothetical protein
MPNRKPVRHLALTAAGMVAVAVLAAPTAGAAAATHNSRSPQYTRELGKWKKDYSISWTWKTRDLHLCVKFSVYGNFTYKTYETITTHAAQVWWRYQKLNDPTMRVVVENSTCKRKVSVGEVAIAQHWTGYSCDFNPSLSIGVGADGVDIGIAGWPSCGNRTQVIYHSHYPRGSQHTQFNSGSPTALGAYSDPVTGVGSGLLNPPPCYGVYPSATVYYRGNSDSFNSGNLAKAGKVCLSKFE